MFPATVFQNFSTALDRLDAQFGNLAHQAGEAVEQELAQAREDAMAFLDGLKAHAIQHPEPLFALLRKVKPTLIVKDFALVTLFDDVQEVLARDAVFQVTYGEKMRVITGGNDFFLGTRELGVAVSIGPDF